jgi:lysozyme
MLPIKIVTIESHSSIDNIIAALNIGSSILAGTVAALSAATEVSEKGKLFIKSWEQGPKGSGQPALKVYDDANKAYRDELKDPTAKPKGFWTIGYGHLLTAGEKFGKGISTGEAETLFETDLKRKSVDIIKRIVTAPLSQQQFDALASYIFNTGSLKGTKLLANINKNDMDAAVKEMDIITSNGKVMRGLVTRRENEHKIWLNGIYENHK